MSSQPVSRETVKMPGKPLEAMSVANLPGLTNKLWQLSYIQRNALKTTLVMFEEEVTTDVAVGAAKEYCRKRGVNFSWLELAIVSLKLEKEGESEVA